MEWKPLPARCRKCRHCSEARVYMDGEMVFACMYMADRYEQRGCPPDENCTRFEPGKRKRGWYLEPLYPV